MFSLYSIAQQFLINSDKGVLGANLVLNVESLPIADSSGLSVFFEPYIRATISEFNTSIIKVIVPKGCQKGKVQIVQNGKTFYSSRTFSPIFTANTYSFGRGRFGGPFSGFSKGPNHYSDKADINNDGQVDFAITPAGENGIGIIMNKISAQNIGLRMDATSFKMPILIPTDTSMYDVKLFDLNNDGKPEIIATSGYSNAVFVFENLSTKDSVMFAQALKLRTSAVGLSQIALADLNNDFKPEVIVSSGRTGKIIVFKNSHQTTELTEQDFADTLEINSNLCNPTGTYSIMAHDFNSDGKPDIASTVYCDNSIIFYENNTTNSLSKPVFGNQVRIALSKNPCNAVAADFNEDGKIDLAICHLDSIISILQNNLQASSPLNSDGFAQTTIVNTRSDNNTIEVYYHIESGDFNGDGLLDIVTTIPASLGAVINTNKSVSGGTIVISPSIEEEHYISSPSNFATSVADYNMDGRPDIVLSDYLGSNTLEGEVELVSNLSGFPSSLTEGVKYKKEDKITLYPNPTSSTLYIKGTRMAPVVSIFNLQGAFIKEMKVNASQIDVAELNNGMYVIHIDDNGTIYRKLFVKE